MKTPYINASNSGLKRDMKDSPILEEYFREHNYFLDGQDLIFIASGMVASNEINSFNAFEFGNTANDDADDFSC